MAKVLGKVQYWFLDVLVLAISKRLQSSRETSLCQELDQASVTSKVGNLPDNGGLNINRMKDTISGAWNACGSVRGVETDAQNFKTNMEMHSSSRHSVLMSNRGDLFGLGEYANEGAFQDDEKAENVHGDEKQPRKWKRSLINETQIMPIEKVLLDKPEMHRNAVLLQSWAEQMSAQVLAFFFVLVSF